MSLSIKSNNNAPASRYLEVSINEQNHTFSLIGTNKKPNSALTTLETIKQIFGESFEFAPTAGNPMTQTEALQSLKNQANAIQQGYTEKASNSWYARNFKGKKKTKIEQLNRSIQSQTIIGVTNLNTILNQGCLKIMLGFLDIKSNARLRSLNKPTSEGLQLSRAKELGYEGNSKDEAIIYIANLSKEILKQHNNGIGNLSLFERQTSISVGPYRLHAGVYDYSWVQFHPNGTLNLERTMAGLKMADVHPIGRFCMHEVLYSIAGKDAPSENRRSNNPLIATLAKHYKFPMLSDGTLTPWQPNNLNPDPAPGVSMEEAVAAPAGDAMYSVD